MEIHLSLLQEKGNRVKNYFPSVIFFSFLTAYLTPYLMIDSLVHPHTEK